MTRRNFLSRLAGLCALFHVARECGASVIDQDEMIRQLMNRYVQMVADDWQRMMMEAMENFRKNIYVRP